MKLLFCRHGAVFVAFFLLFLWLLPPSHADAQKDAYTVGPRDVLNIKVYAGGEKYQDIDITVSSEGITNIPLIGEILVSGHTVKEVEEKIREPFSKDFFVDPQVYVVITEYRSLYYSISGAVKSPGLYETRSPASLMELIARAGGVLPERGNVAYVFRESENAQAGENGDSSGEEIKDTMIIDLVQLLDRGDLQANMALSPGDLVYIPLRESLDLASSKVYVEGRVNKPGVYDFQLGLTALSACLLAGGFDKFAAPNRASIIRVKGEDRKVINVNLNDVQKGSAPDPILEPGDRIFVPRAWF